MLRLFDVWSKIIFWIVQFYFSKFYNFSCLRAYLNKNLRSILIWFWWVVKIVLTLGCQTYNSYLEWTLTNIPFRVNRNVLFIWLMKWVFWSWVIARDFGNHLFFSVFFYFAFSSLPSVSKHINLRYDASIHVKMNQSVSIRKLQISTLLYFFSSNS